MPVFFPAKDRRFLASRQGNFYSESLPKIRIYFPKSTVPDDFDALYRESQSEQLIEDATPHDIPGHLLLDPPESEWKAMGIDEERSIKLSFSKAVLDKGYVPEGSTIRVPYPYPRRGCLVMAEGRLYYLTEIRARDYYGNDEDNWFTRVCWGVRHHPDSIDKEETVEIGTSKPPVDIIWS